MRTTEGIAPLPMSIQFTRKVQVYLHSYESRGELSDTERQKSQTRVVGKKKSTPHAARTHTQAHKKGECSLKDYNMTKTHAPNENCLSCAYSGFEPGATFRCVFWTLYKFRAKVLPREPTKKHFARLRKWDASSSPAVHNLLRSQCKGACKTTPDFKKM